MTSGTRGITPTALPFFSLNFFILSNSLPIMYILIPLILLEVLPLSSALGGKLPVSFRFDVFSVDHANEKEKK